MQPLVFLGRGIRFPFRFSERTGGTEESSDLDRIRESILQILETRPGERLMRPEFGSRVKDLVFEQNDAVLKGLLRFHITDAIRRWEKRVTVTNVSFDDSPETTDTNRLLVRIAYRVIQSQVEGNMVFPFYREGR
ncbi:MAG: Gene 25-like lysozyme [Verrucomicrobia bacterium ADurb.Bin345]|jgi:phage baseplate assembly protein W|nr:MAG: Gene 25-like lysozyme [Verrucomicrobia bacterium ADurb.Bin345]